MLMTMCISVQLHMDVEPVAASSPRNAIGSMPPSRPAPAHTPAPTAGGSHAAACGSSGSQVVGIGGDGQMAMLANHNHVSGLGNVAGNGIGGAHGGAGNHRSAGSGGMGSLASGLGAAMASAEDGGVSIGNALAGGHAASAGASTEPIATTVAGGSMAGLLGQSLRAGNTGVTAAHGRGPAPAGIDSIAAQAGYQQGSCFCPKHNSV